MSEFDARAWLDGSLYGFSVAIARGDGTYERVDPRDVRREMDEREKAINDSTAQIARLREQLLTAQDVIRVREDRISVLTAKIASDASVPDETTDVECGRAFLERLRERRFGDDWDIAFLALDDVVNGCNPKDLTSQAIAAVGRVLRGSE